MKPVLLCSAATETLYFRITVYRFTMWFATDGTVKLSQRRPGAVHKITESKWVNPMINSRKGNPFYKVTLNECLYFNFTVRPRYFSCFSWPGKVHANRSNWLCSGKTSSAKHEFGSILVVELPTLNRSVKFRRTLTGWAPKEKDRQKEWSESKGKDCRDGWCMVMKGDQWRQIISSTLPNCTLASFAVQLIMK